jgi:hypothetical protein
MLSHCIVESERNFRLPYRLCWITYISRLHRRRYSWGQPYSIMCFAVLTSVNQNNHQSARNAIGIVAFASLSIYAAYSTLGDMFPLRLQEKPSSVVINPPPVVCERIARPLSRISPEDRVYHSFDNVLLIVFFSHARYDANLDFYRLTYEEFFPNVSLVTQVWITI